MKGQVIGRLIQYRGKWVRVREEAAGFVRGPRRYWVKAVEPVAGYDIGEEFTVSERHVYGQLKKQP